jgi:hypothetical protein
MQSNERNPLMNKLAISLLAGAAALVAGSAQAAPLSPAAPAIDSGIENVRMVCDEYGRCWRQRGARRVIIERDSYNYYGGGPRYGYGSGHYGHRHHYHSGPGVQFNAPGVSVGIGAGRW